jgi:phytol kinase
MFGDICAIIIVLVVLALLMQGLSIWQRKFSPHPEIVRKLVHSVMGAVTLSFPWIFQSPVSVALLGLIAGTGLTLLKRSQKLQATLGSVLCAVKRQSCGEVAFVAAIVLLFFLTHNNPLLYCIPVLILTLSDSCSALVGVFMGKHRFTTSDGTKSVEGSFAFLISTLVATAIPLFLFSSLAPANIVVIGLLLGGLVMMFEAVAWRGLDNFLIPVSSFILLSIYLDMSLPSLVARVIVAAMLLSFAVVWRSRTTLHDGATIGATLACYASVAVGGPVWLLAPLTVLTLYKVALPERYHSMPRVHSVRSVVSVVAPGLVWLLLAKLTGNPSFFFPYTLSFAAHFAMITSAHLHLIRRLTVGRRLVAIAGNVLFTWLLFFLPYLAMSGWNAQHLGETVFSLLLISLSTVLFHLWRPGVREELSGTARWARQFGIACCISPLSLYL